MNERCCEPLNDFGVVLERLVTYRNHLPGKGLLLFTSHPIGHEEDCLCAMIDGMPPLCLLAFFCLKTTKPLGRILGISQAQFGCSPGYWALSSLHLPCRICLIGPQSAYIHAYAGVIMNTSGTWCMRNWMSIVTPTVNQETRSKKISCESGSWNESGSCFIVLLFLPLSLSFELWEQYRSRGSCKRLGLIGSEISLPKKPVFLCLPRCIFSDFSYVRISMYKYI